jgi:hypothetical protein
MSGKEQRFNPKDHLRQFERRQRQIDGSYKSVSVAYLDVKWRLVWFREEHPHGSIQTDLLSPPGVTPAVVKATVTLENGVTATGFGQCGEDDWSDWLEKAETRAIGRALALLGYGTQFCEDFDDVVSDSPVEGRPRRVSESRAGSEARSGGESRQSGQQEAARMTSNQRGYIEALAREVGLGQAELTAFTEERFERAFVDLNRSEASEVIQSLQELKEERARAAVAA